MSVSIFEKIVKRQIPADIVFENDDIIAFRDISPQAPVHVLVIPREPVVNLAEASDEHQALLGHLLLVAAKVARQEGLTGFRTVINSGAAAIGTTQRCS